METQQFFRCDRAPVSSFEREWDGRLRVRASVSKVGPLLYARDDGQVVTEFLEADELFNADSLRTAGTAAVTLGHPPEFVTPANWRKYARGSSGTRIDARTDSGLVEIVFMVGDQEAIDAVEQGEATQVSAGYLVDVVKRDGQFYQTNRRYNHFALVPAGRAGPTVRLHMDGYDVAVMEDEPVATDQEKADAMKKYKDMEMSADAVAAFKKMEQDMAGMKKQLDAVTKKDEQGTIEALTAERDTLQGRVDALAAEVEQRLDADQVSAEVALRLDVWQQAKGYLPPTVNFDATLSAGAIKALAVSSEFPKLNLDGKPEAYIEGLWDQMLQAPAPTVAQPKADTEGTAAIKSAAASGGSREDSGSIAGDSEQQRTDSLNQLYAEASAAYQNAYMEPIK